MPGGSIYSASKFALEGWAEGMNVDMKPFGIHFIPPEPGPFRTDFANADTSMQLPGKQVPAYDEARTNLENIFRGMNGKQASDPAKLAKGLLKVVNSANPPLRLLISEGALPAVDAYYKTRFAEFEQWQNVSADSDFEE